MSQRSCSRKEEYIRDGEKKGRRRDWIGPDGKGIAKILSWKTDGNEKITPKKMVLLPSTEDKGI